MKIRAGLIFALFGLGSALAQTEPTFNGQIAVFPLTGEVYRDLFFSPRGNIANTSERLAFNPRERSLYVDYSGPAQIQFYVRAVNHEGVTEFIEVASTVLSEEARQYIIFFDETSEPMQSAFPTHQLDEFWGGRNALSVSAFPDTGRSFPSESLVVFNTTRATFNGILGERQIQILPGVNPPLIVADVLDREVRLGLAIHDGERHHRVLVSNVRFTPERRTLLVLRPPAEGQGLRIRAQRITEYTGRRQ